jgi:hypothetical protein
MLRFVLLSCLLAAATGSPAANSRAAEEFKEILANIREGINADVYNLDG